MKWIVFGTGVQGASHIRSGTECQDSYKKHICDDGTIIMAVADGHGSKSCPFSKTGSSVAVNVFVKILSEYIKHYSETPEQLISFLNREGDTKVAQTIDHEWKKRIENIHRKYKREMPQNNDDEADKAMLYAKYGTTLIGLVLTEDFLFALQIGDGDIVFASAGGVDPVIKSDKILGVETHSMSKKDSWKKAITVVRRLNLNGPSMILLSSDGFANSYKNEDEFNKTCAEYLEMINKHGAKAVSDNLKDWLSETSEMGCGDDITVLIAYASVCAKNDDYPKGEFNNEENASNAAS